MKVPATVAVVVSSFFLLFAGTVSAQQLLKGVSTTSVVIEELSTATQSTGLDADQLQTDVELRLRKAGIRVEKNAMSFVYVRVSALKVAPCEGYAVTVSVEFHRGGSLEFVKGTPLLDTVAVWSRGTLAISSSKEAREYTRQIVADMCDKFLNDYLAANPKP